MTKGDVGQGTVLYLEHRAQTQGMVLCVPPLDTNNRLLSQIEGMGESTEKHSSYTYDNNGNLLMRNMQIYSDVA